MSRELPTPITCLVTGGETTPASEEFRRVLALVEAAVAARVSVVQLREKSLPARTLFELAARAAALTRGSETLLVVNDRADIARAAACDGVHLTAQSLEARTVRRAFGEDFLIGVSAHTLAEARAARDGGADFAVLGPVFDTPSKRAYGPPLGTETFREAALALAPFPLLAIGGVARDNFRDVLLAGARGVAAIRLFGDATQLQRTVREFEDVFNEGAGAARDSAA
ncbi:MAG TPA: thiamine phosphate synthase [Pyrinomonadaceae bacterium]